MSEKLWLSKFPLSVSKAVTGYTSGCAFLLLAANLMNSGKITTKLIDLARVLTGWMPGELSHVNVAVSMLFAGISGSSTADAAGCGKILIPAMVKEGYDRRFAIAITACSSVMGVIIPPSILMGFGVA